MTSSSPIKPPLPPDEPARLAALRELGMLDTAPESRFDDLVALAAHVCAAPIALVSLVDADRQWFKAQCGLAPRETPREFAFCAYAILAAEILEVPDACADERFAGNPLVLGPPGIRFYAGAPLIGAGGYRYGTLCVIDTQPRRLQAEQKDALVRLARQVVGQLEARRAQTEAKAKERTLEHLLESIPDGVVSCDANGLLGEFNRTARDWHGVDPRALPPEQWARHFDLFEPDGVQPLATDRIPLLRAWKGEQVRDAELVIKANGQPPRTVLCNGEQLTGSDGVAIGAVIVMRDVTQLRAATAQVIEQSRNLATVIDGTRAGTWEWNVQSGEIRLNERWAEIVGYRLDELAPLSIDTWRRLAHPDDLEWSDELHALYFSGQTSEYDAVCRMRHKDGHWVWVHDRGRVYEWDAQGQPLWMAGSHLDVTTTRQAELAIADAQRRLQAVVDASLDVAIIATDTVGCISLFNPGAERLLGYTSAEMTGSTPTRFHLAAEIEQRAAVLQRESGRPASSFEAVVGAAAEGRTEARQWTYVRKDGSHRQVRLSVGAVRDGDGIINGYLGTAIDITEQVQAQEAARLAAERFSGAFAAAAQGMALVSLEGRWLDVNQALCGMLGYTRDELLARDFQTLTHPDDLTADLGLLRELLAGTRSNYHLPKRYFARDGHTIWARLSVSLVRDAQGQPLHFVSQIQDVTDQHNAEERLRNSEERLRVTLHSIADAVITADTGGVVTYANPMAETLLSRPSDGVVGQPLQAIFQLARDGADAPADDALAGVLDGDAATLTSDALVLVRHDGSRLAITTSAAQIRHPDGSGAGVVVVFRDVTEARALASRVSYQASHDPLTDLANRREFERQLASALQDARTPRKDNALLFIDLDGFKAVNDSCGHVAGDALLQHVGRVLRQTARSNDLVARLGGDEFAVILRSCAPDDARRVAEQLGTAVADIHFEWGGQTLAIGASIGVTSFSAGAAMAQVVGAADAACYTAKQAGKNRVCVSDACVDSGDAVVACASAG